MEAVVTTKGGLRYRVPDFQKTIITPTGGMVKVENMTEEALGKIFDAMKANAMEYLKSRNPVQNNEEFAKASEVSQGIATPAGEKKK